MKFLSLSILLLAYTETFGLIISPLGVLKKGLRLVKKKTTVIPGAWGAWGSWDTSCSVTCGIGYKRRTRNCGYTGKEKKRRCRGHRREMKNCDTKLTCPVHGGWTNWVTWDCSVSCGGGVGMQKRKCTNPVPMFGGKTCEGMNEDYGTCNAQKCADQIYTLSPNTALSLKDAIEKVNYNFEKREGSNIDIPCEATVIQRIYKEYPGSILFWTKNGKVLKLAREKMQVSLTELSIVELSPEDSGVYLCSMRYAPEVVKPLTVVTVAVTPKRANVQVPMNENLVLFCNSAQLSRIYKTALKAWFLNGEVYEEFTNATSIEGSEYVIKNVSKNMTGIWKCQITVPERGFIWTINITKVKILPPIPLYLKLLGDRKFLLIAGTAIFLIVVTVGTFFAYRITRAKEEFMADFELWCLIIEQLEMRGGASEGGVDSEEDVQETSSDEEESFIYSI